MTSSTKSALRMVSDRYHVRQKEDEPPRQKSGIVRRIPYHSLCLRRSVTVEEFKYQGERAHQNASIQPGFRFFSLSSFVSLLASFVAFAFLSASSVDLHIPLVSLMRVDPLFLSWKLR